MNLLPSDPMYDVVMADQAEENEGTILADAFRTKIYNLLTSMPWGIDPENHYIEYINQYAEDNFVTDEDDFASVFIEYGICYLDDILYPDDTGSRLDELETQIFRYESSEEGNGTWIDLNGEQP